MLFQFKLDKVRLSKVRLGDEYQYKQGQINSTSLKFRACVTLSLKNVEFLTVSCLCLFSQKQPPKKIMTVENGYFSQFFPPLSACNHSKHHLCNVKCMTPVVICHVTIVLLNGRKPSTQDSVVDVKTTGEIKVNEHSKGCLEQKKNFYSCVIFGQ